VPKRRVSLAEWIHEVRTDRYKDGKCTAISLVHMQGTTPKEIYTIQFGDRDIPSDELGALFQGKADTYCQEIPGVQTFNLLAFYNNEGTAQVEHPFIVNGDNHFEGLATEGPTERGATQQGMRLTEVIVQRTFGQISVLMGHTENIITRADRRIEHLENENREVLSILKEIMLEKANLSHEKRMAELEYERKSAERAKLAEMLPALVNTASGREIFPQSKADTALVESFADGLSKVSPEQIAQIAAILPPQLLGPLMARMQAHLEKKRVDAEDPRLLPKGVDSELDS
jgi:hypothetical protein